jgi:hypothetical protein
MMGGGARPPAYSPPAGTPSGLPGASYPVMGSAPITNTQPRYSQPGMAQMRPGMAPPAQPGAPQAPAPNAPQGGMNPQQGAHPQQLATALTQLKGGMA